MAEKFKIRNEVCRWFAQYKKYKKMGGSVRPVWSYWLNLTLPTFGKLKTSQSEMRA